MLFPSLGYVKYVSSTITKSTLPLSKYIACPHLCHSVHGPSIWFVLSIHHLETHFNIGLTFLSCLWDKGSGSHQDDSSFSSLAFASKLSNPHHRLYDMEALENRINMAEIKWLSYQNKSAKPITRKRDPKLYALKT